MRARRHLSLLLFVACAVVGTAGDAHAQTAIAESAYVTGGAFVDIKRFSGDPTEGILDGNVGGAAVAVGTHIGAHWDLQAGLDVTGYSQTDRPRTTTLLKESYTLHSIAENQVLSVATLLRYRAAPHGRWRLGYLAGLSFIRLRRRFHTEATADTPSGLVPKPNEVDDYSAAPTVGLDARFALSEHLSVVPGIHACVFRFGEDSGLLIRPRIGLRWSF
jgi:outer membrane protein with beta-barrel domain